MRRLNEEYADGNVDLLDGIKVFGERGWVQVLPDPDEPLVHLYAEGANEAASVELASDMYDFVTEAIEGEEIGMVRGT
jgi:mannose-1-phosphate guanylyltransferase/phosphomannomutase